MTNPPNEMNPINQDPQWFENQELHRHGHIENQELHRHGHIQENQYDGYIQENPNQMYDDNMPFSDKENHHEIYSNEVYSTAKKNVVNTADKNSISKMSRQQYLMGNNQNIISIKEEGDEFYPRENEIKSSRSHYLRNNEGMNNSNMINNYSMKSEYGSNSKLNGSLQKNNVFTKNSSHIKLGTNYKQNEGNQDTNYINIETNSEKYVSIGDNYNKPGITSQHSYHNGKMMSFGDSQNNSNYNRISQNERLLGLGNRSKDGSKHMLNIPTTIPEQNSQHYDFAQDIQQQNLNGFYTPQIAGKNYYPSPNTINGKNYSNKKPNNQGTFQCHLNFNSTDKKSKKDLNNTDNLCNLNINLNIGSAERRRGLEVMPPFSERARSDHEEPTLIDINTKDGINERLKVTKSDLNDPNFVDGTMDEFVQITLG